MAESSEVTPNGVNNEPQLDQQIVLTESGSASIKRELEEEETTQSQSVTEEPILKKIKLEPGTEQERNPSNPNQQSTSSPSPLPQTLTANSRSEIRDQISQLTKTDSLSSNNIPALSNSSSLSPIETPVSATSVKKELKQSSSVPPTPSKSELISQSDREIEDIIDGSDLRKFLHRTLTSYMVKGMDEIINLWESGNFQATENDNDDEISKKVVLKFADILRQLAENK